MPHPKRKRTFLLYMAGDNDLSDAGLRDVEEICREGASAEIHVGLEIDTRGDHTGSIRYEITEPDFENRSHRTVIERLTERDSGQPRTLREFLLWGLDRFPAEETVLVVGGHGDGFRNSRRSVASDESGSSIDMNELSFVLERSGLDPQNRLSILGFDACLMCMLEIAHHFRPYAHILVGSQQVEPGDGWPYDRVLRTLKRSSESGIELAAVGITEAYAADYKAKAVTNVTQSAIRLDRTDAAMKALSELGGHLAKSLPKVRAQVIRARNDVQTFFEPDYVDAIDLAAKLRFEDSPKIAKAVQAFRSSVKDCVIRSRRSGQDVQQANGLSIWFPEGRFKYATKRSQYRRLDGVANGHGGWLAFLDSFFEMP